jgi:hypothetical protein
VERVDTAGDSVRCEEEDDTDTYHFQFDGLGVSSNKHGHAMINGLIPCPIVRKNKGEVDWCVPVLDVEIPIGIVLVFHFVFSVGVGG